MVTIRIYIQKVHVLPRLKFTSEDGYFQFIKLTGFKIQLKLGNQKMAQLQTFLFICSLIFMLKGQDP